MNTRSVALQGVGYGHRCLALQGFGPCGVLAQIPSGSAGGRKRFGRILSLPIRAKKKAPEISDITPDVITDIDQLETLLDQADKIDAFQKSELRAKAREETEIKQKILRALEAEFLEKEKIKKLRLEEEEFMILLMLLDDE